ncbi:hypothetical protein [Aeromonas media]
MSSIVLIDILFDALKLMSVAIFMGVMGSIALIDAKQKDPVTGKYKKNER